MREKILIQKKELESLNRICIESNEQLDSNQIKTAINTHFGSGLRWGVSPLLHNMIFHKAKFPTSLTRHIVIVVPMKYEKMKDVPSLETATEVLRAYAETGDLVIEMTKLIQSFGYNAYGHHPLGNLNEYHALLFPPHAVEAGLGEQGRTGLFIDHQYGPMVRLGIVSTDAPLVHGKPVEKGINAFCHRCIYCAKYCPPRAISQVRMTEPLTNRLKFSIHGEKCIRYFEKHYACGKCLFHCVLVQPTHEETKKRMDRIANWFTKWVQNGPPEEWGSLYSPPKP